ncbi:MAG TPA: hypothetical protein VEB21_17975 [Terriglobales bacterium]|nr:hypothetical protein [Terriglobales bacterium]
MLTTLFSLSWVAPTAAVERLYVHHSDGGSISVLEPASGTREVIDLGESNRVGSPTVALFLEPSGERLFVVRQGNEVVAVDTASGAALATIMTHEPTGRLFFHPGSRWILAVNTFGDHIEVIEATTLQVVNRIAVGGGNSTDRFAAAGGKLFVFGDRSDRIVVVDMISASILGDIRLQTAVREIAAAADGQRLFALDIQDQLLEIDVASARLLRAIPLRAGYESLTIASDGTHAYLLHRTSGHVVKLDLRTGTTVAGFRSPGGLRGLVVSADGTRVTTATHRGIYPLQATTLQPSLAIATTGAFEAVSGSRDGRYVLAIRRGDHEAIPATGLLVDTLERRIVTEIETVSGRRTPFVLSADAQQVFFASGSGYAVYDLRTGVTLGPLATNGAAAPSGGTGLSLYNNTLGYALSPASGVVSRIDLLTNSVTARLGPDYQDARLTDPRDIHVSAAGLLYIAFERGIVGVFDLSDDPELQRVLDPAGDPDRIDRILGSTADYLVTESGESIHRIHLGDGTSSDLLRDGSARALVDDGSLWVHLRRRSDSQLERYDVATTALTLAVPLAEERAKAIAKADEADRVLVYHATDQDIGERLDLGERTDASPWLTIVDYEPAVALRQRPLPNDTDFSSVAEVVVSRQGERAYVLPLTAAEIVAVGLESGARPQRLLLPALARGLAIAEVAETATALPLALLASGPPPRYVDSLVAAGAGFLLQLAPADSGWQPTAIGLGADTTTDAVPHPDGRRVYVGTQTGDSDGAIQVVDLIGQENAAMIALPGRPIALAIPPDGTRLYALLSTDDRGVVAAEIEIASNTLISTLDLGFRSTLMAYTSAGDDLHFVDTESRQLISLDLATGTLLAPVPLGEYADQLVSDPAGSALYAVVHPEGGQQIVTIDPIARRITAITPVFGFLRSPVETAADGSVQVLVNLARESRVLNVRTGQFDDNAEPGILSSDGRHRFFRDESTLSTHESATGAVVDITAVPRQLGRLVRACHGERCQLVLPPPARLSFSAISALPVATATATATPEVRPTPIADRIVATIETVSGRPGELVELVLRMPRVSAQLMDLRFQLRLGEAAAIPPWLGRGPDCEVLQRISGVESAFTFFPSGCEARGDCGGISTRIEAAYIGDSQFEEEAFRCRLLISSEAEPAVYPLVVENLYVEVTPNVPVIIENGALIVLEEDGTPPVDLTPLPTATVTPPAPTTTATATATAVTCAGDCDGNGAVFVNELMVLTAIALGETELICAGADRDGDGNIQVDEIAAAVTAALAGCDL